MGFYGYIDRQPIKNKNAMTSSYPATLARLLAATPSPIADAINEARYNDAVELCMGYAMNGDALRCCRELAGLPHDHESTLAALEIHWAAKKAARAAKFAKRR